MTYKKYSNITISKSILCDTYCYFANGTFKKPHVGSNLYHVAGFYTYVGCTRYKDKFETVEGKLQFVKRITDERFDIDEELLSDIKTVFEERYHKKIDNVKGNVVERVKKQKVEPATDKQLKYAKKLYIKVNGEAKGFDDKEYSKHEMVLIIGDLVERLDNMEEEDRGEFAVVELSNFRK